MKDCLNDNLSKIKALLLDTDDKLKIGLDENPKDSDLKMILGKRLGFFKELYHRDVDNAMVVFDKGNDVPEEAVKDNEVSKEKDDVPEKEKDDVAEKEKDVEKVSNEIYDVHEKGKDVEKVVELGGIKTVQTHHSVEMGKDVEARRKFFDENIDIVLKQGKRKEFQMDVICFEIEIIDNIDNEIDDIKTRYGGFPYALQVEFSWKTTYNSHDCGIFVMRHMETYLGKGNFLQDLNKEGPGQKVQLNMMRAKYMVKILLMSFNEKKKTLLKEAQAYMKVKPKSYKMLTGNDVRVDEELWKRFNETVIKTIDD
ncbi:hypothetical protein Tco_1036432 [Tanacetum coccineum]